MKGLGLYRLLPQLAAKQKYNKFLKRTVKSSVKKCIHESRAEEWGRVEGENVPFILHKTCFLLTNFLLDLAYTYLNVF